ncbi:MAG: hypothetical protein NVSMB64_06930 [Candidatus Velthaea sp.]
MLPPGEWLAELGRAVRAACPDVDAASGDEETLTLARGRRSVFVQIAGDLALVAPARSAGSTIAERIAARNAKLDIISNSLTREAAAAAAAAVAAHLRS